MFLPFVLSSFKYSFVPELASIDATTFLAVNAASLLIPATISASVTFEPAPPAAVTVTSTLQMFTFKPSCEPVKLIPLPERSAVPVAVVVVAEPLNLISYCTSGVELFAVCLYVALSILSLFHAASLSSSNIV